MALNSGEGKNKTEIWDNTRVTHAAMRLTAALEQVIHIIILSFSHHFIAVRLSSCFFFFFWESVPFPRVVGMSVCSFLMLLWERAFHMFGNEIVIPS